MSNPTTPQAEALRVRLDSIIASARQHVEAADAQLVGASSARLALADAFTLRDDGLLIPAAERALRSLAYTVGVFHPDYKRADETLAAMYEVA